MEQDDVALIKRISDKEMLAVEELYHRYENIIYRFAFKKLSNEFDAAEIVNTVMLEVWNTAARFEGRSKVSTWLIGIAHHRIIDHMRKRKYNHVNIDEIEPAADETNAIDMHKIVHVAQIRRFIDGCLSKLSAEHKQVMELLFFQEATYEEMASCMACSIGTIKSRVYHAKKLLKKCLEKQLV